MLRDLPPLTSPSRAEVDRKIQWLQAAQDSLSRVDRISKAWGERDACLEAAAREDGVHPSALERPGRHGSSAGGGSRAGCPGRRRTAEEELAKVKAWIDLIVQRADGAGRGRQEEGGEEAQLELSMDSVERHIANLHAMAAETGERLREIIRKITAEHARRARTIARLGAEHEMLRRLEAEGRGGPVGAGDAAEAGAMPSDRSSSPSGASRESTRRSALEETVEMQSQRLAEYARTLKTVDKRYLEEVRKAEARAHDLAREMQLLSRENALMDFKLQAVKRIQSDPSVLSFLQSDLEAGAEEDTRLLAEKLREVAKEKEELAARLQTKREECAQLHRVREAMVEKASSCSADDARRAADLQQAHALLQARLADAESALEAVSAQAAAGERRGAELEQRLAAESQGASELAAHLSAAEALAEERLERAAQLESALSAAAARQKSQQVAEADAARLEGENAALADEVRRLQEELRDAAAPAAAPAEALLAAQQRAEELEAALAAARASAEAAQSSAQAASEASAASAAAALATLEEERAMRTAAETLLEGVRGERDRAAAAAAAKRAGASAFAPPAAAADRPEAGGPDGLASQRLADAERRHDILRHEKAAAEGALAEAKRRIGVLEEGAAAFAAALADARDKLPPAGGSPSSEAAGGCIDPTLHGNIADVACAVLGGADADAAALMRIAGQAIRELVDEAVRAGGGGASGTAAAAGGRLLPAAGELDALRREKGELAERVEALSRDRDAARSELKEATESLARAGADRSRATVDAAVQTAPPVTALRQAHSAKEEAAQPWQGKVEESRGRTDKAGARAREREAAVQSPQSEASERPAPLGEGPRSEGAASEDAGFGDLAEEAERARAEVLRVLKMGTGARRRTTRTTLAMFADADAAQARRPRFTGTVCRATGILKSLDPVREAGSGEGELRNASGPWALMRGRSLSSRGSPLCGEDVSRLPLGLEIASVEHAGRGGGRHGRRIDRLGASPEDAPSESGSVDSIGGGSTATGASAAASTVLEAGRGLAFENRGFPARSLPSRNLRRRSDAARRAGSLPRVKQNATGRVELQRAPAAGYAPDECGAGALVIRRKETHVSAARRSRISRR